MIQGSTPSIELAVPDSIDVSAIASLRVDLVLDGKVRASLTEEGALESHVISIPLTEEMTMAMPEGLYRIQTRIKTTDGTIHGFRDLNLLMRPLASKEAMP